MSVIISAEAENLKEAVLADFVATANEHLDELRRVYMEGGTAALWAACRADNGIGYEIRAGEISFMLHVLGAEEEGQEYVGELAGEAAQYMQDWEETQEYADLVAEAEANGEQDPDAAARRRKCEKEKWDFYDFSTATPAEFLGSHLDAILAKSAMTCCANCLYYSTALTNHGLPVCTREQRGRGIRNPQRPACSFFSRR